MRRFLTRIFVIIFIYSIIITGANMIPVSAELVHSEIDSEQFGALKEETGQDSGMFSPDSEVKSETEDNRYVELKEQDRETEAETEYETEYITEDIDTDITIETATEITTEIATENVTESIMNDSRDRY